ncbi:MAG: DUF3798 domain-containing protein [Treponema sp.]|jgi:hypothetical protein|nr:DUF3798 domain-containing protein [Treponema sp.]
MKKTVFYGTALGAGTLALVLALLGCRNFFHELVPPDENRITSFSVPGQMGPSLIGETTVHVTVAPGTDIAALLPGISVSPKATLLPVTLPYIQRAFPSANLFREVRELYASPDRTGEVIDLIRQNPDFTVPALDGAIDFSGPVNFLVVSGLGNIRQYTVMVEVDTGEGKFRSFGFTKFDNPDLTRGDAAGVVDNAAKTIDVTVWYPVENIASFVLVPSFETNGASVSLRGLELVSGTGGIDFGKPALAGWGSVSGTQTLTVQRPEADLPSPLMGYPGALGLDLSAETGNFPAILRKVEEAVNEKGGAGKFGTWAFSYGFAQSAGWGEYAKRVIEGTAKLGNLDDMWAALSVFTPGAQWNGAYYVDANTGVGAKNHLLIYMDTYIMGVPGKYLPTTDQEVPEQYYAIKFQGN